MKTCKTCFRQEKIVFVDLNCYKAKVTSKFKNCSQKGDYCVVIKLKKIVIKLSRKAMTRQYLNNYDIRITDLRSKGDELMKSIESLTNGMERRRNQRVKMHEHDLNRFYLIVKDIFEMLSEIKICEYFKTIKKCVCLNSKYYKRTCENYFEYLVREFNRRLKEKEMKALNEIHFEIMK